MSAALESHALRAATLARQVAEGRGPARLDKDTSNLFRGRSHARRRLDVRGLDHVISIDTDACLVDAEGMVTYEALVDACLARGVMPAVVPQLKTITLGGAVAGVGIEASSHRYGLVHETVEEIEVLTGDGRLAVCTPRNEHSGLFFGFPNSYGTLGYALRVKARVVPVKPFVRLEHLPFTSADAYFAAVERHCAAGDADFVDGTIFSPARMFLTLGRFEGRAPYSSDYTRERIYYRSVAERREDWLTTRAFLWRWDTDWFWCSRNVLAQNPFVRRLYGRRLGSRTYAKLMRLNDRIGLTRTIDRLRGLHAEAVIQDVDIPVAHAAGFLDFLARGVRIWPVWMCPVGPRPDAPRFALYPMRRELYVNFGFWDTVRTREAGAPGTVTRRIEREVARLGGIKSLYSESFYTPEEFDAAYGGAAYRALKSRYDPRGAFPTLYQKCVRWRS